MIAVSAGPGRVVTAVGGVALGVLAAWRVESHPFWLLLVAAVAVGLAQQALP
jgi:H+/gluconate symporter-like permease